MLSGSYFQGKHTILNVASINFFLNVFIAHSGKASNYCRYAFNVFDQDKNGTLNFTEYVMAMHIHESDDVEESLGLV
jgi:Ca2+-binding EF-hand superfamily protein